MFIMLERVEDGRWRAIRADMPMLSLAVVADKPEDALGNMLRYGGWKCSDAQSRRKG